jgi:hypothetical protein
MIFDGDGVLPDLLPLHDVGVRVPKVQPDDVFAQWHSPRTYLVSQSNRSRVALACLAVGLVLLAVGAELFQLQPVGIVAAILLGDVVAVFAHLARQGDLGSYVGTGGHVGSLFGFLVVLL